MNYPLIVEKALRRLHCSDDLFTSGLFGLILSKSHWRRALGRSIAFSLIVYSIVFHYLANLNHKPLLLGVLARFWQFPGTESPLIEMLPRLMNIHRLPQTCWCSSSSVLAGGSCVSVCPTGIGPLRSVFNELQPLDVEYANRTSFVDVVHCSIVHTTRAALGGALGRQCGKQRRH